jgi:hypothetical protein
MTGQRTMVIEDRGEFCVNHSGRGATSPPTPNPLQIFPRWRVAFGSAAERLVFLLLTREGAGRVMGEELPREEAA